MIKDCDTNGDGVIDYEEFVAMMNKKNWYFIIIKII